MSKGTILINNKELDLYNPYQGIYYIIFNYLDDKDVLDAYNKYLVECKNDGEYPLIKREYNLFIDLLKERGDEYKCT